MCARPGMVYLVGAGPGDPGLLTLRGRDILSTADCVVYDRLVHPCLLRFAGADATLIDAGKEAGSHQIEQEKINALLVRLAREGRSVCRLKGGDPYVFGRGGEEGLACADAGVPFEVVPGITSAIAGPAYAGIPVTHRDASSTLAILPGRRCSEAEEADFTIAADTRVYLMAVSNLPRIAGALLESGEDPRLPCALIERATWPSQRTITGTLSTIAALAAKAGVASPGLLVVGPAVTLRERLNWFERRPLFGWDILVTRPAHQAWEISERLRELGAQPAEIPLIEIEPLSDPSALDAAIQNLPQTRWVIFTSANGVRAVANRIACLGRDTRIFGSSRIAAIGPGTAAALRATGLRADFVPSRYIAESMLEEWPEQDLRAKRVTLFRAEKARDVLPDGIARLGANLSVVSVYSARPAFSRAAEIHTWFARARRSAVTFASPSAVRALLEVLGSEALGLLKQARIACIGPVTAAEARGSGIQVDIEAAVHSVEGLCEALVKWLSREPV